MTAVNNLRIPVKKFKDPQAKKDYGVNWDDGSAAPYLDDGDTILTSACSISQAPDALLILGTSTLVGALAIVWLSGGTVGKSSWVTNHIVTADGREDDQSIIITIKEM